jgi:hypothetical protein
MSALPPKADMFSVEVDVCFVPEADMTLGPKKVLFANNRGATLWP